MNDIQIIEDAYTRYVAGEKMPSDVASELDAFAEIPESEYGDYTTEMANLVKSIRALKSGAPKPYVPPTADVPVEDLDAEGLAAAYKGQNFDMPNREMLAYFPDVVRGQLSGQTAPLETVKQYVSSAVTAPVRGLAGAGRLAYEGMGNLAQLAKNAYTGKTGGYKSYDDIIEAANNQMSYNKGIGGAIQNDPTLLPSIASGYGIAKTGLGVIGKMATAGAVGGALTGLRRDAQVARGEETPGAGFDYTLGVGLGALGEGASPFLKHLQAGVMAKLVPGATKEQSHLLADLMRSSEKRTGLAYNAERAEVLNRVRPEVKELNFGKNASGRYEFATPSGQMIKSFNDKITKARKEGIIGFDDFEYISKAKSQLNKRLDQVSDVQGLDLPKEKAIAEVQDWIRSNPRIAEIIAKVPELESELLSVVSKAPKGKAVNESEKHIMDPREKAVTSLPGVRPPEATDFTLVGLGKKAISSGYKPGIATLSNLTRSHSVTPITKAAASSGSYPKFTTVSEDIAKANERRKKDKK